MRWTRALRATVAVACLVLVGGAARAGGLHLARDRRPVPSRPQPPGTDTALTRRPTTRVPQGHGGHVPAAVPIVIAAVAVIAVIVLLAVVVRAIVRTGWRPRFAAFTREPVEDPDGSPAVPDAELVARSALAALAALDAGEDPRTAVIAAYAGMIAALDAAGAQGASVLTPGRLLERAAAAGLVDGGDARALTTLFERARFSTQQITARDVTEARDRLGAVRGRLVPA